MNFRWHQRDEKAGTLLEASTLLETSSAATRSPRWPSERIVTSDCRSLASSTSASYVNLGFSGCREWVCCSVESVTCNCSLLPGRLRKDSFTIFLQKALMLFPYFLCATCRATAPATRRAAASSPTTKR